MDSRNTVSCSVLSLRGAATGSRGELSIFDDNLTITTQPEFGSSEIPAVRRPIPVSTLDWSSTHLEHFTPITGLDFLLGAEQVNIQQTVELHDMLVNVESENRYTVKVPGGETLYLASESSTHAQRMCFGSSRAFCMTLYDQTRQLAMQFVRRLAPANCLCGCYPQELSVWIPSGEAIGSIRQQWTLMVPAFVVANEFGDVLYRIEGPTMCSCATYKDTAFNIFSADGLTQLGSIRHQWDHLMVGYNLCLNFPNRTTDGREKALLLGAAFLLEYLYFERAKSSRSCKCLC